MPHPVSQSKGKRNKRKKSKGSPGKVVKGSGDLSLASERASTTPLPSTSSSSMPPSTSQAVQTYLRLRPPSIETPEPSFVKLSETSAKDASNQVTSLDITCKQIITSIRSTLRSLTSYLIVLNFCFTVGPPLLARVRA